MMSSAVIMSATRMRRLTTCPRQEWFHSEAARGGWERGADPFKREAWARKCATPLAAAVGRAVHDAARAIAMAFRDGRRPPSHDALLTSARSQLAVLWRARDVAAFRRNPRSDAMLAERLDGGDVSPEATEKLRVQLPAMIRRLVAHPVWEHVRECGRGDIVVCDALDASLIEVDGIPVKLYAAPDLLYVSTVPLEVPDLGVPIPRRTPLVVDWTTSAGGDKLLQLATYSWHARDHLRLTPGPLGSAGRVGDLSGTDRSPTGGQVVLIGDADIARSRAQVARSVRQIVAWTRPDGKLDRERMPMIETACRWCPYRPLCPGESQARTPVDATARVDEEDS